MSVGTMQMCECSQGSLPVALSPRISGGWLPSGSGVPPAPVLGAVCSAASQPRCPGADLRPEQIPGGRLHPRAVHSPPSGSSVSRRRPPRACLAVGLPASGSCAGRIGVSSHLSCGRGESDLRTKLLGLLRK